VLNVAESGEARVMLTVEQALERIEITPDYDNGSGPQDCVHTFRNSSFMLIGAHWTVSDVRALMEQYGVEEAGPQATAMKHGLVVTDNHGPLFIETKP
jgi:hypothetical protein